MGLRRDVCGDSGGFVPADFSLRCDMNDYNSGKWIGWNGGACPVHPKSLVRTFFIHNGKEPSTQSDGVQSIAGDQAWDCVIAFRVVKEYRETKEQTFDPRKYFMWFDSSDGLVHVREVTE